MADATPAQRQRPLSPHLQIYKPQITSIMSILHRATGIALSVGLVVLAWWIAAAAGEAPYFDFVSAVLGSWIGVIALAGWSFCFFYHLLNGIRHLLWDAGWGFELPQVYASGRAVFVGAIVLTLAAIVIGAVVW